MNKERSGRTWPCDIRWTEENYEDPWSAGSFSGICEP